MYTFSLLPSGKGTEVPRADVQVRLKRRQFRLSFSYSFHYYDEVADIYIHDTDAVFEIGGTRTSLENKDCYWNRSYTHYWNNASSTSDAHLVTPDYTGCIHTIRAYWVNSADGYGHGVCTIGVQILPLGN